jgi:hypothetical protein
LIGPAQKVEHAGFARANPLGLWVLMLALCGAPALSAQSTPDGKGPTDSVPAPAAPGPPTSAPLPSASASGIVEKVLKDLEFFPYVIVVPPGAGNQVGADGTAILPLQSLDAWLDQEVAKRLGHSGAASVTSVDLELDLGSDPVLGRATMSFRTEGNRATWGTISLGEAVLKQVRAREWITASAELGGVKKSQDWIPAVRRSAAGYEVRFDRAGNYEIEIEFLVDVSRLPSEWNLKLSLPTSPVMRGKVVSSDELAFVRQLSSGKDVALSADHKSADLTIVPGEPLAIAWRRGIDRPPSVLAQSVRTLTQVRIEPKTTTMESTIEIGSASELVEGTLRFPADDQNVQIFPTQNDQPLAHDLIWSDVDGKRECLFRLARPLTGPMKIKVTTQRPTVLGDAGMELLPVEWMASPVTNSLIMMGWSPNLWVRIRPGSSARRVNLSELGGEFTESSPRQVFRLLGSGASVLAIAEPARPVLSATADSELTIGKEALLATRFVMSVRGAQADSFVFLVPRTMRNIEMVPADLFRLEELEIDQESPTRQVRAVLAEVVEDKEVEVTLRGEMPIETPGVNHVSLPALESDRFVQGAMTVRVEPGLRLVLDDAGTEYLRREPIPDGDSGDPPAYWFFRRQPGQARLAFRVESLPATVDASVECLLARTDKDLEVRTIIRFRAQYAPFDEVSVSIPSKLPGVQVSSDFLVENVRLEPGAVVPLRLRNPSSSCEIQFDYRVGLSANESFPIAVPLILPRGTTIESWTGRIYTERGLRASVGNGWVGTVPAPSRVVESGRRAVAEIRPADILAMPEELSIQFEPTALLATLVIPRVTIEEVVTPEGSRWARKRWLIAKHRARDISIRLPAGARRLNAFVDGQPVEETPAGEQVVQVRLPAVDAPTTVELDYDFPDAVRRGAVAFEAIQSPVILDDAAIEMVRWSFRMMEDRLLFRWGSAGPSTTLAWLGLTQGDDGVLGIEPDDLKWMNEAGYDVSWTEQSREVVAPRIWRFSLFNRDSSIRLITVREPFWILACSGSCLVFVLAVSRLSLAYQVRVLLVGLLLLTALMAVVPEMLTWLWMGARWGLGLGLLAALVHAWMVMRRQRQPVIGAKRTGRQGQAMGSSILRQLEPKTRITSRGARREKS